MLPFRMFVANDLRPTNSPSRFSLILDPCPLTSSIPFRINTCKSVTKQTTLTSFRMNTYEKTGGRGVLLLTRFPRRESVLRSIKTKGSLFKSEEGAGFASRRGPRSPRCREFLSRGARLGGRIFLPRAEARGAQQLLLAPTGREGCLATRLPRKISRGAFFMEGSGEGVSAL
jgi:hypothetical protein